MLSLFGIDLLDVTGMGMFTAYVVSFTIVTASIIALTQTNLKARLAYSTVSQLSYIVTQGRHAADPHAITGGLLHIANHAFTLKSPCSFLVPDVYLSPPVKKDISQDGWFGLQRMPVTMAAFALASLSMIGGAAVNFCQQCYLALGAMDINNM